MSKKLLTLALALMMVIAVFAGCAQKAAETTVEETVVEEETEEVTEEAEEEVAEEETEEATEEEATEETAEEEEAVEAVIDMSETQELELSCWDIDTAWGEGVEVDKIGQYILDKFNITIKSRNVTWGDYGEKNNLWAAANDMPGTVCSDVVGSETYLQWCNEGVIRSIPDEMMQMFPTMYTNCQLSEVTAYAVNGENFVIPRMVYVDAAWWCMDRGVYYRKDWAEKLGYTSWETEDDYVNMCIDFATKDPDGNGVNDTIGMTAVGVGDGWIFWSGCFTNYGLCDGRYYYIDGNLELTGYTTENGWQIASMLRKIYKGGGFDVDYMTYTSDTEPMDKFAMGLAGVLCKQISPSLMNGVYADWVANQPDVNFLDCVGILPLTWETGNESYGYHEKAYWSEAYVGNKVTDEELPRYLALYEWMRTDEGKYFMAYGFEGEDYELDENGNVVSLLGTNEDGTAIALGDVYPNANFASLSTFTFDNLQYVNPNIPQGIRDMCTAERDNRLANYVAYDVDWELQGIVTDEKSECTASNASKYMLMIIDTSDKTDEEWRAEIEAEWDTLGLSAAIESVDAAYNG